MKEFLEKLFTSNGFMPHGHCYFWKPGILWTHVIADGLIAAAYFAIPVCLVIIAKKRPDIGFRWLLVLFGIFIYSCGTTYIFNIITVWNPVYRLDAAIKVITALASVSTAIVLIRFTPKALILPTMQQWEKVNAELKEQIRQLQEKDKSLQESEQALKESEGRYNTLRDIFDSVIIHAEMMIEYANPSAATLLGASSAEDLIGKSILDFVQPERKELVQQRIMQVNNGEKIPLIEQKLLRTDGSEIEAETISVPFPYRGKMAVQTIVRDISARKQNEKMLRESEAKFRSLFESDMIGTMFWDISGKVTDANNALLNMIGYSREELQNGNIDWVQMTPATFKELEKKAHQQIRETGVHAPYEKAYIRKDGTQLPILVGGALLKGHTDKGVSYVIDITERKQQEKILKDSEAKFKRLFESKLIGIKFSDGNGNITDANDAFLEMIGYTREDLLQGRIKWPELTPPEYTHLDEAAKQQLKTDHEVTPYEKEYIRKDGSRVPLIIGLAALGGQSEKTVSFMLDIRERKKQEMELQQSEAKFRGVFESDMIGIVFADFNGNIVQANDAFLQIIGYTHQDQQQGMIRWRDMTPAEYTELDDKGWNEIMTKGLMTPFEKEFIRKDGSRVPVLLGGSLLAGHTNRAVSFVLEITEQVKIQQDLKRYATELQLLNAELEESQEVLRLSESRFRRMFESDMIGIVFWDKEGNLLEVNNMFLHITGYTRDDWSEGKLDWHQLTPPEYTALEQEKMAELDKTGVFTSYEKEYIRKDGSRVYIMQGGALLEGFQNRGVSYILDITSLKNTQKELEQHALDLARSNEELEQFAYIASHDLQEPLRTMAGFANLLEKKYKHKLDEDAVEFIGFIVDASERMKKLITNLLEFSRINTKSAAFTPTDFGAVINKVITTSQNRIRENNISISRGPMPVLLADSAQIAQLFGHLIGNAIKFRDEKPLIIDIQATEQEKDWLFAVTDTGIGIDMTYSTRIFQVFQRLHSRDKYEGTGIGLAVCKKIVQRHGGDIWVESQLDAGSTFYFTIKKAGQELKKV